MPLNEFNIDYLQKGKTLEFEVFHKATSGNANMGVTESSHLIGVAFVPLKPLVEGSGRTRITGMFDIFAKDAVF